MPPYNDWRERYFASLPGGREIVFLGDSLTAGGLWSEHFPGREIANRGVIGDTTQRLLARLDEVTSRRPELVLLMIGINDLGQRVPLPEIERRYEEILQRLQGSGATVVVQSVLLVGQGSRKAAPGQIDALNAWLEKAAARHGGRFLDLNPALAPEGHLAAAYTTDGTHLTGEGYLRWAEQLQPLFDGGS